MKKQLKEEVSRIKNMMRKINEIDFQEPENEYESEAGIEEQKGEEAPETSDDENLFEMSLNDYKARKLISIYDNASDEVKQMLNKLVTLNSNSTKKNFLKDLENDIDKKDLEYIFSELEKFGVHTINDYDNELLEKIFRVKDVMKK